MSQGKTWWGTVWLEKMERLAESSRFHQGTKYEAGNKVERIRLEGRTIIGKVQGKNEPPYTVRITFDAFTDEQWGQLFVHVRDRFALAALLAAGEMPLEIQTAFSKAKLRFMPERYADLHLECACPDWLKPCCHLVAVWLKFARDFERDPLPLFQLRGKNRKELLDSLRGPAAPAPVVEPEPESEEIVDEEINPVRLEPLPSDPEVYWAKCPIPDAPPGAGERRLLDDDLFEKVGPAPFAPNWRALEPQFHRVYDAVYELAASLLKE